MSTDTKEARFEQAMRTQSQQFDAEVKALVAEHGPALLKTFNEALKQVLAEPFMPCPGCDGHECDWVKGVCAYPRPLSSHNETDR